MQELIRHEIGRDSMYRVWHRPAGNMLLYVHKGRGSIVTSETVYPLQDGVLCFIGSEIDHHTLPDLSFVYDRSKVFVDDALLALLSAPLGVNLSPQSLVYAEVGEEAEPIFSWMERYGVEGGYLPLLSMVTKHSVSRGLEVQSPVEKAIIYMRAHFSEPISIDDICSAIHTSKYYFCRTFKASTGLTVMTYILKLRVVMASHMIERGGYSMTHISEACGFSSPAYFSRVFKEETGLSPLRYKQAVLQKK